ncbi:hypothetical protein ACSSNL_07555 [Thalassobius sp. S69A]|uniref:hypothetical protein n=1 Tax=unclassified Thalassovita TaxID=2619711 RepID=UPI000C10E438|nr:hypothetical protein [Paracoccaceae bacterium]MBT27051.1 hypothetical protein [Paracoccaceae bacterium]
MKRMMTAAILVAFMAPMGAQVALAGPIERACMSSPRKAAGWQLCGCIQRVADQTLTRSDQRMAAKFFSDPHHAQEIRQSDNSRHEAFWLRYKDFGANAAASCN